MAIDPRAKLLTKSEIEHLTFEDLKEMQVLVPLPDACKLIKVDTREAWNRFRYEDDAVIEQIGVIKQGSKKKRLVYTPLLEKFAAFIVRPKTYAQLLKNKAGYYKLDDFRKRYPVAITDENWPELEASAHYFADKGLILLPEAWEILAPDSIGEGGSS